MHNLSPRVSILIKTLHVHKFEVLFEIEMFSLTWWAPFSGNKVLVEFGPLRYDVEDYDRENPKKQREKKD